MDITFNMFDLIFAAISLIFIIVAFFRGFVKELFSLLNWIITIALSYFITPFAARFVEQYSDNKLVINVASGSMVFILIFIITFFATRSLSHDWKEKMPENLDRFLGLVYGVFKSLLIFGIFYAFLSGFYSIMSGEKDISTEISTEESVEKGEKFPKWFSNATSFSLIKFSGEILEPIVKSMVDNISDALDESHSTKRKKHKNPEKDLQKGVDGAGALSENNTKKAINNLKDKNKNSESAVKSAQDKNLANETKSVQEKGYSKKEIEKMNRLIEIVE